MDAAGTPILPGLARYDEVQAGVITHAIRVQAETTDTSYIWPATAGEGSASNPDLRPWEPGSGSRRASTSRATRPRRR